MKNMKYKYENKSIQNEYDWSYGKDKNNEQSQKGNKVIVMSSLFYELGMFELHVTWIWIKLNWAYQSLDSVYMYSDSWTFTGDSL